MEEKLIQKAKDLLFPYENRYYNILSDVYWIEKDNETCDYDYCSRCIYDAVRTERREYLMEQRKLPIGRRDKEFLKFTYHYNYGGGYESDRFNICESCGAHLDVIIIPNTDELEYVLEDLKDGIITDCIGWKAYGLIYGGLRDSPYKEKENELILLLAKRVIEILQPKSKLLK